MMRLTIGLWFTAHVESFEHASRLYVQQRDESGLGSSGFPSGRIDDTHYVSYNGRVWKGAPKDWKSGDVPVCEPAEPEGLKDETFYPIPIWTNYTSVCCCCNRRFYVSKEALDFAREEYSDSGLTDAELAELEYCLGCVAGAHPIGEYAGFLPRMAVAA